MTTLYQNPRCAPKPNAYLTWRAQEDIAALRLGEGDSRHLEVGAILCGSYDEERNRVTIDRVDRNLFVEPHSRTATLVDGELMQHLEKTGRGRVVGDLHTHPDSGDSRHSDVDGKGWLGTARTLEQAWCGIIIAPGQTWEGGFPATSWEPSDRQLRCWLATPTSGELAECVVSYEPEWKARLNDERAFANAVDPLR